MMCSGNCIVQWTSRLLLHASFVFAIWETARDADGPWPAALATSCIYPIVLIVSIRKASKAPISNNENEIETPVDAEASCENPVFENAAESPAVALTETASSHDSDSPAPSSGHVSLGGSYRVYPICLSLLYALFAFSIGAPGAIIGFRAMPCRHSEYDTGDLVGTWETNSDDLPAEVMYWNTLHDPDNCTGRCGDDPSSLYTTLGDMLYFRGKYESEPSQPHVLPVPLGQHLASRTYWPSGPEPLNPEYKDPRWVMSVANDYLCYVAPVIEDGDDGYTYQFYDQNPYYQHAIYCGVPGRLHSFEAFTLQRGVIPVNLFGFDGRVWFQQTYLFPGCCEWERAKGHAIASLDPKNITNVTLHSHLVIPPTSDGNCEGGMTSAQASVLLLLSALPVTLTGGYMWVCMSIPSSSIVFLVGIGWIFSTMSIFFDPFTVQLQFILFYLAFLAMPIWAAVTTFVLTVSTSQNQAPMWWWSVYFSTFVMFALTLAYLLASDYMYWTLGGHEAMPLHISILAAGMVFAPLVKIGVVLGSTLIYAQGIIGLLLDVTVCTVVKLSSQPGVAVAVVLQELLAIIGGGLWIHNRRVSFRNYIKAKCMSCYNNGCGQTREHVVEAEYRLFEEAEGVNTEEVAQETQVGASTL